MSDARRRGKGRASRRRADANARTRDRADARREARSRCPCGIAADPRRVDEKDARNGCLDFGVDAASTLRRSQAWPRAYLFDPRVEIQTLPHDRPCASRDDSGHASASGSRPREWFCGRGSLARDEPPLLRFQMALARRSAYICIGQQTVNL